MVFYMSVIYMDFNDVFLAQDLQVEPEQSFIFDVNLRSVPPDEMVTLLGTNTIDASGCPCLDDISPKKAALALVGIYQKNPQDLKDIYIIGCKKSNKLETMHMTQASFAEQLAIELAKLWSYSPSIYTASDDKIMEVYSDQQQKAFVRVYGYQDEASKLLDNRIGVQRDAIRIKQSALEDKEKPNMTEEGDIFAMYDPNTWPKEDKAEYDENLKMDRALVLQSRSTQTEYMLTSDYRLGLRTRGVCYRSEQYQRSVTKTALIEYPIKSARPQSLTLPEEIIKKYYPHANLNGAKARKHWILLDSKILNKLPEEYQKYRGDVLKTKILIDVRRELRALKSREAIQSYQDTFIKTDPRYQVIKQAQGHWTWFWGKKTASLIALESLFMESLERYPSPRPSDQSKNQI